MDKRIYIYIYIYITTPLSPQIQLTTTTTSNNLSPCCFGHCSVPTLQIFCFSSHLGAEVVVLPNPSFEPATPRRQPGKLAPSWEVPSRIARNVWPKTAGFHPKQPPNPHKAPEGRETLATLHMRAAFTVPGSPVLPFNSTICLRNSPKRRQKAPKSAQCAPLPRDQARAVSWATWLKSEFQGHVVHLQTPLFMVSKPQNCPTSHLDPGTCGHLVQPEGNPARARFGQTVGPLGSPGRKKSFFPTLFPHHLGCSNRSTLLWTSNSLQWREIGLPVRFFAVW